ncbi:hyalin-like [Amphiura filiformis]|uniref:hyalin-like n=1 Tax=Amphiura filiformis TaxID=82378 RepID=UPI003B20C70F
MEFEISFIVIIIIIALTAHLAVVQSNLCMLKERPDHSRGGVLRWSLLYKEICYCQGVVAPRRVNTCPRREEDYEDGDLWFVDDPSLLIMRQNWKKDILDELLNRARYCEIRQAPVTVSCPTNLDMETDPGKATAMVVYQSPTATDNSGEVRVVCYPPSASEFAIGQTTVTCVAGDRLENSVTCDFQVHIKDVQAPSIESCPTDMERETDPGKATAMVVYQNPTATDNSDVEAPAIESCHTDIEKETDLGKATALVVYQTPTATDNSGEVSVVCTAISGSQFPIGRTTVACEAQDGSENSATCHFQVDIRDVEAPAIESCPTDMGMETDPNKATAVVIYQTPTATDNSGEVSVVCNPASGSQFPIGQTTVSCVAGDNSKNSETCDFLVDIKDVEAPAIESCPTDIEKETDLSKATVLVVYQTPTATDNSGEVSVVCTAISGSQFPIGRTTVACEAQDGSGNSATCHFQVDIRDVETPAIESCPTDMGMETDPNKATAVVIYQTPSATDNSGEVSVVCNPASGSQFPIGQTTVSCVAGDNSKNSETCDFLVDIKDVEAPAIESCPTDIEKETDLGKATALVVYQTPTATDNSGDVSVVCTAISGSQFPIGRTTVACEAQDGSENSATCHFQVDIRDVEAPAIESCPTDMGMETDPNKATAVVIYQTPTATDNSGEVSVVCNPASGSQFPIGQTTVSCVAGDNSKNSETCDFLVDIKDLQRPVIVSCHVDQVKSADPGKTTTVVVYQTPTATDNSGEVINVVCHPPSGSEFLIGQTNVTCVALDNSGNNGSCYFQVNIKGKSYYLATAAQFSHHVKNSCAKYWVPRKSLKSPLLI